MKLKTTLLFFPLALVVSSMSLGQTQRALRIGVVIDGKRTEEFRLMENMKEEILDLTSGEFDVRFPPNKTIEADWTIEGIRKAIDQLVTDPDVDLVLTLGMISSHEVCLRGDLTKPVIAPIVLDADVQGLPIRNGRSGVKNLNYISVPRTFEQDIQMFQDITSFRKLAVLLNQALREGYPSFAQRIKESFGEMGIETSLVGVGESAKDALAELPEGVEAVYVLPLAHLPRPEFEALVSGLINRRLPSFSYVGAERVEQGLLASLNKKDVITRISRRVALNVQRILLGEAPEDLPVAISLDRQLTINMATAKAIGVSPSWAVLTEAEVFRADRLQIERRLDLFSAVQEALDANLDLAAKEYYVAAGRQDVNEARSKLLPSIDIGGTYLMIDKDRAEGSFGQQAERTLTGSVTGTQVIFSEPAWANFSVQKNLQRTREFEHDQLRLDIIQDAATSYLNLLQEKTFEKIQQENLKVTRQNLNFARVREVVGSAGPAEVYRWESEVASNRKAVINANAQRNLAEIQLNRLLHRPAEEGFLTQEIDLNDPILITSYGDLFKYIDNKQAFRVFREFMVEEALKYSPELAALDAAIAVQKRLLRSSTNSFWSPTVAVQGQVQNIFSRGGVGKDPATFDVSSLPPELQGLGSVFSETFPEPKDLSWSIGLDLSFPLFSGGEKFAVRQKAVRELRQLQVERDAAAERIEQWMRSALHVAGASHASIKQARIAAAAANKSLRVVQDSYSQGMVSIVELLDAQHAALVTDQAAANAVYDFLIDLMQVERTYGRFNFFSTDERRKAFFERANAYFEESGIPIE